MVNLYWFIESFHMWYNEILYPKSQRCPHCVPLQMCHCWKLRCVVTQTNTLHYCDNFLLIFSILIKKCLKMCGYRMILEVQNRLKICGMLHASRLRIVISSLMRTYWVMMFRLKVKRWSTVYVFLYEVQYMYFRILQ